MRDGRVRETWEYGANRVYGWQTILTFEGGTLTAMERTRTRGGPDLEFTIPDRDFHREADLDRARVVGRGLLP